MPKFTTPSNYLRHQDLDYSCDTLLTIDSFKHEQIGKGDDKAEKWVLYFAECEKGLALNSTNGKILCKLFGEEMNDWPGKRIAVYVKDDVEYAGETVSAIRIRPRIPE